MAKKASQPDEITTPETQEAQTEAVNTPEEPAAQGPVTPLGENRVRLAVSIPAEEFNAAVEQEINQFQRRITVPGFRRGKAPRNMVLRHAGGPAAFFEDAFHALYPTVIRRMLNEHGLTPVASADIEMNTVSAEEGVSFTADFWVYPQVTLGQYKNLNYPKPEPTDVDVELTQTLEDLRRSRSRVVTVDRPAADGDEVELDFTGSIDGVPFEGGAAEHYKLTLGSGRFIPGFEEQVAGLSAGEERDIQVTFPEDYAPDMAGKDAVFHIVVHEVAARELPEVTDEFIQDATGEESLEAWRARERQDLEHRAAHQLREQHLEAMLAAVVEGATMMIPPPMLEDELEDRLESQRRRFAAMGIAWPRYLEIIQKTEDQLREELSAEAERTLRMRLVLTAIREKEEITISDEQIAAEVQHMAAAEEGGTTEQLVDHARGKLMYEKLIEMLAEWNGVPAAHDHEEPAPEKAEDTSESAPAETPEASPAPEAKPETEAQPEPDAKPKTAKAKAPAAPRKKAAPKKDADAAQAE